MQLSDQKADRKTDRKAKPVGMALAAATCALLGQASSATAKGVAGEWDVDTAVLFYSETNNRVQAAEPVVSLTRNFDGERTLNVKLVADTLTGASPNGATPSNEVQTFTRPSGEGNYTVNAGEDPLDDTFHDTRGAGTLTWSAPINRDWRYNAGVYGSMEYDYTSFGVNGGVSRYLNNKNTTINAGLSLSLDTISPEGDIPIGLSQMALPTNVTDAEFKQAFAASRDSDSDSKTIIDILAGVTQVINRRTIMQFNYALSLSDGYQTDPFKIVSVIDTNPGENYGGNLKDNNGNNGKNGNNIYLYEKRPDSRFKHVLYWQTKYMFDNGDVLDGSYRFMLDDWGINSHTVDVRYRWNLGKSYLEPHVRYYLQSEADFYQRYLTSTDYNQGTPTVSELSADYRLGELSSATLGLKWGYQFSEDRELSIRAEYMKQSNSGDSGVGLLASQDLYPDTDAFWLQVGFNF
ncbi:MAG: DUF3570 domain-containing protein [Pseudomonadales bacterium]|nr:DUF3570 domain-containing protein [Pseudomonadales bacterium]